MGLLEYERLSDAGRTVVRSAANIPCVDEKSATGEVARIYDDFRSHFGRKDVPGILQCFATHPPLLRHMMELSKSLLFSEGALGRRHKEMIAAFVSARNGCAYCADSHAYFLRVHGGSAALVCAIEDDDLRSGSMTHAEQCLLEFSKKVNESSSSVVPADIELLASSGWTQIQIAETVHITALFATFNRVANAFGLQSQNLLALYTDDPSSAERSL